MLKLVTENLQNYLCRELRTKSLNFDLRYPSEIENIFKREKREREREREKETERERGNYLE